MPDPLVLELANVRGVEAMSVQLGPVNPHGGSWTVLLGENGAGKTTVLRALAWCLSLDGGVHALVSRLGLGMLRDALEPKKGAVKVVRKAYREVTVTRPIIEIETGSVWTESVFGYGPSRGSALGGPDRDVAIGRTAVHADTLFDPNARLIHAETWLRNRAFAALKSPGGRDEAFFEAAKAAVIGLLPGVDHLEVGTEDVTVSGPAVGACRLQDLADGYLATLGWTLDLIARWAHANPDAADGDFSARIRAMVLVDEVDLHLHPRWQRRVIPDLKAAFPAATFVVTTHNPLTAQSVAPGELRVLDRDAQGRVRCRAIDPPPGADVDDLLTGPWFGLSTTYDRDTVQKLADHADLVRKGAAADDPRRVSLETVLRERLVTVGPSADDRALLERAAREGTQALASRLLKRKLVAE